MRDPSGNVDEAVHSNLLDHLKSRHIDLRKSLASAFCHRPRQEWQCTKDQRIYMENTLILQRRHFPVNTEMDE